MVFEWFSKNKTKLLIIRTRTKKNEIQNLLKTIQAAQENPQPEDGQGSQETEESIKTKTKEIQIAGVTAMLTTFGEILKTELKF